MAVRRDITKDFADDLAHSLKNHRSISELNLRRPSITKDGAKGLSEIIKENQLITTLHLILTKESVTVMVLKTIISALAFNQFMTTFVFDADVLDSDRVYEKGDELLIIEAVGYLGGNKFLTTLYLSLTMMNEDAGRAIASILEENILQTLYLNLLGTENVRYENRTEVVPTTINSNSFTKIAQALEKNTSLLSLSWYRLALFD